MPAGLEALPPPPALPGPLPLAGQVLAVAFATITGATNASPVVVTTAAPHYLVGGVAVTISGVVGNTAANTTAVATVLTPTTFSIPVAGNGAYASGGTVTVNVLAQSVVIADPTDPTRQAGVTAGGALKTDASATIQPISVATLPLPLGAAQDGTDGNTAPAVPTGGTGIRGWLASIYQKIAATIAVTQSGSWRVTADAGTNLNTSALATEGGGNLATIAGNTGKIPALGQATKVGSTPVTLASDQGAVTISGGVTANAGTNLNTSSLALAAQLPATLGQKAMAGSASVTLANDQSSVPTNAQIGAPLIPTGAANLTISTDGAYTFASLVHHVVVQNNTATAAGVAFDATATAGSYQVPANSERAFDLACTVLHLFSAAASAVNGTAAANIVVMGAI